VRLAAGSVPELAADVPLVVFLNHASWWDPLVGLEVARRFFPGRTHYAAIDAEELDRYRFFRKLGFFGVERGTARGARSFLRTSEAVLAVRGSLLWITPEGRFADPRERPLRLRPGIGLLARRLRHVVFLPLALEYPFWEERLPEALARFGEPVAAGTHPELSSRGWAELLAARLEGAMDALRDAALRRDPADFEFLLRGRTGVGVVYDLWRSLRARVRGERFRREHGRTSP
jgi:1-acyl-sn-glycerol-3-phosphate acyltransferase